MFELMNELPSTAVSDNQSSARKTCQRGDQRDEREERVEDVPEIMTSVFMCNYLDDYRCFLHRF